jgi:hypothetical protein
VAKGQIVTYAFPEQPAFPNTVADRVTERNVI